MKIQGIVSDVRQQVVVAGRNYQGAFKAYVEAQRRALAVVTSGGSSLANTEIGAAKNIFSSARASFEQARKDGLRQLASEPKNYVPKGRAQLISAYKTTIDQLVKTSTELNEVVSTGYRNVIGQLTGVTEKQVEEKPAETASEKPAEAPTTGRKTASRRRSTTQSAAGKKTTASKSTTSKTASGQTAAKSASKTTTKSTKAKTTGSTSSAKKTAAASTGNADKSATAGQSADSAKTSTANNSTTS